MGEQTKDRVVCEGPFRHFDVGVRRIGYGLPESCVRFVFVFSLGLVVLIIIIAFLAGLIGCVAIEIRVVLARFGSILELGVVDLEVRLLFLFAVVFIVRPVIGDRDIGDSPESSRVSPYIRRKRTRKPHL